MPQQYRSRQGSMSFLSGRKTVRFLLSLQMNAMLAFIMFIAIASISRNNKAMTLHYGGMHSSSFRTLSAWTAVAPHGLGGIGIATRNQPRIVFLENSPWKKAIVDGKTGNSSSHQVFPERLPYRTPKDIGEELDPTRYYDQVDSADFPQMERRLWPQHEFDSDCEPMAKWQSDFHPVCNEIHATADIRQHVIDEKWFLLSNKGYWRYVWRHQANISMVTVWKTFKISHNFEEKFYEDNRVDIVAIERLSSSPYVASAYAFCGLTIVQEFAGKGLGDFLDSHHANSIEKLKLAKKIAQGVAAMHSIKNDDGEASLSPSLVNNDINPSNLLFTNDGRPVFSDFNIAILVMKHKVTGESCPFYSHFPNPQWKAPEEQQVVSGELTSSSKPPTVDSKIDIYALGNIFYRIAVGTSPWKRQKSGELSREEKRVLASLKRNNGILPPIPEALSSSKDPTLAYLLEAMRLCYTFDPARRPTAKEIVDYLDNAIDSVRAGTQSKVQHN